MIYNIEGQGFTRLHGTFGMVPHSWNSNRGGTITITAGIQLLGVFTLEPNDPPIEIRVDIPPNEPEVRIRVSSGHSNTWLGFGNAYFS